MRAEHISPRTWLIAGAAAWAVCLWALALAGMGGRIAETAINDAPQRLPSTTLPGADRPGPLGQYTEIGARPLFSANRRPQRFVINAAKDEAQSNAFDYTLTSILISPQVSLAIVKATTDNAQPVRVKVGEALESAPQWTLVSVRPRGAVFRGPEGEKTLELRVFDGVGGAVPVAAAQPAVINEAAPPRADVPGPNGAPEIDPNPPTPPVATTPASSTQAQLEAIRKRIEARRAQLRQQSQTPQNQAPSGQPPADAPQPGQTP